MIYVDADACPVKDEVERVGTRHKLRMFVVSNGGIRPSQNPLVETGCAGGGTKGLAPRGSARVQITRKRYDSASSGF